MDSGKVVSKVGDQVVVELPTEKVPKLGMQAFCDGSRVGVVFDIIGRVDKPYVVVRTRDLEGKFIGKQMVFK